MTPTIRYNEDGTLDEFICDQASVHLEQMDSGHWWLGVQLPDGTFYHLSFTSSRKILAGVLCDQRAQGATA